MKAIMAGIIDVLSELGPQGDDERLAARLSGLRMAILHAHPRVVTDVITMLAAIGNLCDTDPTLNTQDGSGGDDNVGGIGGRWGR